MRQLLQRHGFIYDQLPAILWAALIFGLSSLPGIRLPHWKVLPSDKVAHFVAYFILAALIYRALAFQQPFPKIAKWSLLGCILLTTAYGASDEIHQAFVPHRDASLFDLMADLAGALVFSGVVLLQRFLKRKRFPVV